MNFLANSRKNFQAQVYTAQQDGRFGSCTDDAYLGSGLIPILLTLVGLLSFWWI